ncbi:MAG TPA: class I SAM-dependent methyltransferase [Gammaproteobacteria bacterium]|nr:class I SAM-dependent methyltransferase [Gammaproteobacteria bacterium]
MSVAEQLRYRLNLLGNYKDNQSFRRTFPAFQEPPTWLIYETSGDSNLPRYREYGHTIAEYYHGIINRYQSPRPGQALRVCDWGCGTARIVRYMPDLFREQECELYATDYDAVTIEWCSAHIPDITFQRNNLEPPLEFADGFLDVLYCLSVFTHLSESMHFAWINELSRVLRPGGLLMLTLHGDQYRNKLLPGEREQYESGKLVVREGVAEGSRMFAAFHPPAFVRDYLLRDFEILEHKVDPLLPYIYQDQWIARKR